MLNRLAKYLKPEAQLGDVFEDVMGTIKIISENPYCVSCQGVVQQFNEMFPNLNIILIDGTRVGY
ncbi:MAG: hypothetical protein HRT67_13320 [Flavobacteriaceae bacterium]|nr:hypothetical protein [Flavobacteriaceae bacterium]